MSIQNEFCILYDWIIKVLNMHADSTKKSETFSGSNIFRIFTVYFVLYFIH